MRYIANSLPGGSPNPATAALTKLRRTSDATTGVAALEQRRHIVNGGATMAKTTVRSTASKSAGAPSAKKASFAKSAAAHVLSAPKGPRTVTHRELKAAVDKVFRERAATGG